MRLYRGQGMDPLEDTVSHIASPFRLGSVEGIEQAKQAIQVSCTYYSSSLGFVGEVVPLALKSAHRLLVRSKNAWLVMWTMETTAAENFL